MRYIGFLTRGLAFHLVLGSALSACSDRTVPDTADVKQTPTPSATGATAPDASACRGVGHYQAGKEGSYLPCCDGLTETEQLSPAEDNNGNPVCTDLPLRVYACVQGTCGDAVCEVGEDTPCGCLVDCPQAAWETETASTASSALETTTVSDDSLEAMTEQRCSALVLEPDASVRQATCGVRQSGDVVCDCGAGEAMVAGHDAGTCQTALSELCGTTDRDLHTCGVEGYGVCAPDPVTDSDADVSNAWLCLCDGQEQLSSTVGAETCDAAAFSACSYDCDSPIGRCIPTEASFTYDCECGLYGQRQVFLPGYACEAVLLNSCEPGHGLSQLGSCTDQRGYCDPTAPNSGAWLCRCLDGSVAEVAPDPQPRPPDFEPSCGVALEQACGVSVPPAGSACQRTTDAGGVRCERSESEATDGGTAATLEFSCSCGMECQHSASESSGTIWADSCEQAMDAFCGVGGPSCE